MTSGAPKPISAVAYAIAYARMGWPVFPLHAALPGGGCTCGQGCGNPGKHPRTKNGLKNATTDDAQIRAWWQQWPDAPVALCTGERSALVVIDIDPRSGGVETWSALVAQHDALPITPCVRTGGGGSHLYFAYPESNGQIKSRSGALGPGVDVKACGGYVVAPPSLHKSGQCYAFRLYASPKDLKPAPIPPWLLALISEKPAPKSRASQPISAPSGDGWLVTAFRAAGWIGDPTATGCVAAKCPWSSSHTSGRDYDSSTVLVPPRAGSSMGWLHCSHAHCQGKTLRDVIDALPQSARDEADVAYPKRHAEPVACSTPAPSCDPQTGEVPSTDWVGALKRNPRDGTITSCLFNACSILAHDDDWAGVLAYDEFIDRAVYLTPPPWLPDTAPAHAQPSIEEHDAARLCAWLHDRWAMKVSEAIAMSSLCVAAHRATINPLRTYLESLRHDGVARVSVWLMSYLGCETSPYTMAIGRRWLIAAVARALSPGCQVDSALILEGPQGSGKSSALRALAGPDWYADNVGDLGDKDSADALRGKWIIELSELSAHKKSDAEAWKSYISRRIDHFRPAYARVTIDRPRSCVFAGSTNLYQYITDETGARRHWAVRVGHIRVDALAADRDQLWAEAVALYRAGEQWWLTAHEQPAQVEAQDDRRIVDPWHETIASWADKQCLDLTTERILDQCLDITTEHRDVRSAQRVGAIMRLLGYESARVSRALRTRLWRRP